jgi:ubiquinone/menaquinone biosynthesis C-methylase UbiE
MIEIGSGIGRMTAAFTREFDHVIAADLDIGFLERCHETVSRFGRADHLRTLEVADGRSLALNDDSVDFAFSYLTLQHCAQADALNLAREAVRVTRSGGRIVLNFRGPSRIDPLLLPLGTIVRFAFRLPRVGQWLSQRRSITRLAWQVSRISPSQVLAALGASIDGVTIWSGGPVDDLQGAFHRGHFEGINENHWWITATVV